MGEPRPVVLMAEGGVLSQRELETVAEALWADRLVAFPTETVYGLAANAASPDAVRHLFAAKGRPEEKPLPVMVADASDLVRYARHVPAAAWALAQRLWPGPLTIVLARTNAICDEAAAGGETVALRLPSHDLTRSIIRAAGVPVAVSSANRSGEPSTTSADEVLASLGPALSVLVKTDVEASGLPSTVIDLTASPPSVLRWGGIQRKAIEALIGEVVGVAE